MADAQALDYFLAQHGPAVASQPIDPDGLEGRVPPGLLELYRQRGIGLYAGGMLQLCDPRHYDGALETLFANDPDLAPADLALYALTAFGTAYVWHLRLGSVMIWSLTGEVTADGLLDAASIGDPDMDVGIALATFDRDLYDVRDDDGRSLFAAAAAALGLPGRDEIYMFVPAPALGGALRLDTLHRRSAPEALGILVQAQAFHLLDTRVAPSATVRQIGA